MKPWLLLGAFALMLVAPVGASADETEQAFESRFYNAEEYAVAQASFEKIYTGGFRCWKGELIARDGSTSEPVVPKDRGDIAILASAAVALFIGRKHLLPKKFKK